MGLNRWSGNFRITGRGDLDSNDQSTPDAGLPSTVTDPLLWQPGLPETNPAGPSKPTPTHGGASADPAIGTSDIHDVVFIDSNVPDIQDLLNGLKPGEKAFVIDANSDGLSQIATILQLQHLTNLSGIEIVAHGASGQLDLGSTVLNDADLAGHATALSTIGAALAPGGDLALYACETAAGATGQQFISDLSHYAGGVDVAAATHLVGDAAHGGSWTLDASTGAPVTAASVPFTSAALDDYHGELSGTDTGQLFFVNYESNESNVTNTRQIDYLNSNDALGSPTFVAAAQTGVTGSPGSNSYLVAPQAIGVDTPNGFFFALDNTGILYSGNTSTGAEISAATIASHSNGDNFGAMTVDPVNHLVYLGIFGGPVNANDTPENEIYALSYNAQTGALGTPQYNASTFLNSGTANTLISTASDPNFNGAQSLTLDQTANKLYIVEETFSTYNDTYPGGSFLFPEKNEIDVISSTARNQTTQETLVSLPTYGSAGYIGYVGGVAVDEATDKLYFSLNTSTNTGAIYYVSLDGGANQTPTKLDLTGLNSNLSANGLLLENYDNITIDPATGQLYVTSTVQSVSNPDSSSSITDPGEIYRFTLNGAGTAFTGASVFYQYGTATSADLPFGQQLNLDFVSLPTLTVSGTLHEAVQLGSAVTLLTAAPTVTEPDGAYLTSATVTIGNFQSGDVLAATVTGNITESYSNGVLTLTGVDTFADYEQVLASVTYRDGGIDSSTGSHPTRTITWQVNNGEEGNPSGINTASTTVVVDRIPVLVAVNSSAVEGASTAPGNVLTNATDKDGDTFLVAGFTGSNGAGTPGTSYAATYGHLTLGTNGVYSYVADNTSAINAAPTGSHLTDTFLFTVSDGFASTTTQLQITIDRPPVLSVSTSPETYTPLSAAQALQSAVTISDPDGSDAIASAHVTLTRGYSGDGDLLSYNGSLGSVTLADNSKYTISYLGSGATETLNITTVSGTATQADYQQLLDGIVFSSTAADPTNGGANATRSATFQVTDVGGAVSATAGPEIVNIPYAASISSVAATTVGNVTDLDATKVVTITVNFNTIVNVTGAPELQLNDNEVATYTGGTGTTALTFSYTVQPGDNTADLQVQSLLLNSGTIQDGAGHAAVLTNATADLHLQVDTTAPGAPTLVLAHDTGASNTDHITSDPTITVTPAESGGTLLYKIDGAAGYSAAAPNFATDGSADGAHTVSVEQEDAAGNIGAATSISFTLETIAPATPTLALAHDTGILSSDHITSDPAITFSALAAGDTLLYKVDGAASYSATVPVFATDGSADGAHTVSVEQEDAAGNISAATSLNFTLDTTAPGAPTLALADDTGVSNTDHITNDPAITVAPAESGGILLYKIDGATSYSTTAPVFATDGTADGAHTVSVEQEDAAGNIGAATSISFTLDTIKPATPTLALVDDTGISGTDHITSDPAITYSAPTAGDTLLYKVDGGSFSATVPVFATDGSADGAYTVSVEEQDTAGNVRTAASLSFTLETAAPGAPTLVLAHDTGVSNSDHITNDPTITVTPTESGGILLYKIDGAASYSATAPNFATDGSADGVHTVSVEQEDAAGNIGAAASISFTLDTNIPPTPTLVLANDTGLSNADNITSDPTITYSTPVAGDVLLYKVDNAASYSATVPVFATDGSADGAHTVSVEQEDAAGNVSAATSLSFTLDTVAPGAPTLALADDTGASNTDHITSDPTITVTSAESGGILLYKIDGAASYSSTAPNFATDGSADGVHTVSVEQEDAAGNIGAATSISFTLDTNIPPTPTLALVNDTGLSNADNITSDPTITYSTPVVGDVLLYKVDGAAIYSATAPVFATDGSADGAHTVSIEQEDTAGNVSTAASLSFTLETVAPGAPTLALTHDTGVSNADFITSDPAITVTPAESGGILLYNIDGAASYSATAPSFATDGSADGIHTVSVEQEDAAGNIGAATSISFTLDTTAPAAPTLALANDTGISATDHITSDPTITYSAPAAGDTLLYKVNGAASFSATVPVFATDHSADGLHTVSVEEQDTAGNISAVTSLTFTLDTTPPILTGITASPASGSIFAGSTDTFTFDFKEAVNVTGGTPSLTLNDGGTAVYDATATAALHDSTKMAFDYLVSSSDTPTSSLAITGYAANGATVTDLAGNLANLSSVAETFSALSVNESHSVPALTINGFTRPALELDSTGHIILDAAASAAAATYGIKFLYLGLPESTPYPPVADPHLTDFHLVV